MRIGVFSDDAAGAGLARLLAAGLRAAGGPVELSTTEVGSDGIGLGATDFVLNVPLAALRDRRMRSELDVVITVGRDHPAATRALRAARFDAPTERSTRDGSVTDGRDVPPWFMPCSHQADLRTRASLAAAGTLRLPFATRAIPFMVPRVAVDQAAACTDGELPLPVRRTAVLLAALAVAVDADPFAREIGPGTVAALATARADERARATSDRLLALTTVFEALDEGSAHSDAGRPWPRPCARRPIAPRPLGRDVRAGPGMTARGPRGTGRRF